ncbi:PREDICTED: cyclin-D3-1-like [Tarenaya hassleriana]|uniref:cyclin-D3-1-like n=1 Tax=Tarenaya hassleriana TaxID=28532 RepID=UPI00053C825C|nr:PREDICTED: cyclin-D3-1-like [Tarenaya hassleriana]
MANPKENGEAPQVYQVREQEQSSSFLLDALYCEEETWGDDEEGEVVELSENTSFSSSSSPSPSPFFVLDQDLFWEDEELISLFAKEQEHELSSLDDAYLSSDRKEAVDWILRVSSQYGFSTLTAVLAMKYLDRFICSYSLQRDKPWMLQLVAVTCLSLAAKVEETRVPLLIDLQVEETKYVFEAKTIQRMELLILSTLGWKMHHITPISFLDHIIRRLGLKNNVHWDFLRRCERLLLSVVSDSRFVGYLPSVLAAATMMHVIEQVEHFDPKLYQDKLLDVLKLSKEKVKTCYDLILELPLNRNENPFNRKRKFHESTLSSPSCVIDTKIFDSESSNDSLSASSDHCHCYRSSVCSSPQIPPSKKLRGASEKEKPTLHQWAIVASP